VSGHSYDLGPFYYSPQVFNVKGTIQYVSFAGGPKRSSQGWVNDHENPWVKDRENPHASIHPPTRQREFSTVWGCLRAPRLWHSAPPTVLPPRYTLPGKLRILAAIRRCPRGDCMSDHKSTVRYLEYRSLPDGGREFDFSFGAGPR